VNCPLCGKEYDVETSCVSSSYCYSKEDNEWVSMQGFIERRSCCHEILGQGYGDVEYFKTKAQAIAHAKEAAEKIGEWIS